MASRLVHGFTEFAPPQGASPNAGGRAKAQKIVSRARSGLLARALGGFSAFPRPAESRPRQNRQLALRGYALAPCTHGADGQRRLSRIARVKQQRTPGIPVLQQLEARRHELSADASPEARPGFARRHEKRPEPPGSAIVNLAQLAGDDDLTAFVAPGTKPVLLSESLDVHSQFASRHHKQRLSATASWGYQAPMGLLHVHGMSTGFMG